MTVAPCAAHIHLPLTICRALHDKDNNPITQKVLKSHDFLKVFDSEDRTVLAIQLIAFPAIAVAVYTFQEGLITEYFIDLGRLTSCAPNPPTDPKALMKPDLTGSVSKETRQETTNSMASMILKQIEIFDIQRQSYLS